MQIDQPTPAEYTEFLALVDAEIRPHRAKTHSWDDFPLILHEDNRRWTLIARGPDGVVAGGVSALIREFTTNYGAVSVAGIGSVVTHQDYRGQGISRELQIAMLAALERQGVPLAVLWTDQPAYYAGRGFFPAGWEFHLDLSEAELPGFLPDGCFVRSFNSKDVGPIEAMYQAHPCRTLRLPGDAEALYTMPGTQGFVLEKSSPDSGENFLGVVFCGKGADFPDYVTEWNGEKEAVLGLLAHVREAGLATQILVPAGEEAFAEVLVNCGAGWEIKPSGLWKVLDPRVLATLCGLAHGQSVIDLQNPQFWLGGVNEEGGLQPGVFKLGIWGFDSV